MQKSSIKTHLWQYTILKGNINIWLIKFYQLYLYPLNLQMVEIFDRVNDHDKIIVKAVLRQRTMKIMQILA